MSVAVKARGGYELAGVFARKRVYATARNFMGERGDIETCRVMESPKRESEFLYVYEK